MIVSYRATDQDEPKREKKSKVKLYRNRAYIESLKDQIIREHNEKIKARKGAGPLKKNI